MMKSLYSGIAGMRSHQTKMDVIGNNIANVNTNSYKSQRTTFRDMFYQTVNNSNANTINTDGTTGAVTGGTGGTNFSQVGTGTQVGAIDTNHEPSAVVPTGNPNDLAISGEGYFVIKGADNNVLYTRLGITTIDAAGYLVDTNGNTIYGVNGEKPEGQQGLADLEPIVIDKEVYRDVMVNPNGMITAIRKDDPDEVIVQIAHIYLANIPNKNALQSVGNSYYAAGNNTGEITYESPGEMGVGEVITGALEMSNVDLAQEFSDMIITQRGYQANTRIISVVDQMLEELVNLKR